MAHNVASDQGLHCLLTGFSMKNRIKTQNRPNTPKMTNGLVQHITVEESTSTRWVKRAIFFCKSRSLLRKLVKMETVEVHSLNMYTFTFNYQILRLDKNVPSFRSFYVNHLNQNYM